jgi:hypothetical protein
MRKVGVASVISWKQNSYDENEFHGFSIVVCGSVILTPQMHASLMRFDLSLRLRFT